MILPPGRPEAITAFLAAAEAEILASIQQETHSSQEFILEDFPEIKRRILTHINEFFWIDSEYVSTQKSVDEWLDIFRKELSMDAAAELQKLKESNAAAIRERENLIEKLDFSDEARKILAALNEFVAQRDWSKGWYCSALAHLDLLLAVVSTRVAIAKKELLHYDIEELLSALQNEKKQDVSGRFPGWLLLSKEGKLAIHERDQVSSVMKNEGLIDMLDEITERTEFRGIIANAGKRKGKARVIDTAKELDTFEEGEILVTYMTTMEFTPLFKKAAAIITDEGGLSSHAAIISREFGLPCIVGTNVATRSIKTGDLVEVDAEKGVVRVLQRQA